MKRPTRKKLKYVDISDRNEWEIVKITLADRKKLDKELVLKSRKINQKIEKNMEVFERLTNDSIQININKSNHQVPISIVNKFIKDYLDKM